MRLLLADDHAVMRSGLRNALANRPTGEVVREAGDGRSLREAIIRVTPDLLVVDVAMPDFDPAGAIRQVKSLHPAL